MHYFKYKGKHLYCENLKVHQLIKRFGTPLYIYSRRTIVEHYLKLKEAFKGLNVDIYYSVKANSHPAILKILKDLGSGFDIVSGGELFILKNIKVDPERIVYAGVGKTRKEIEEALNYKVNILNVESLQELEEIDKICAEYRKNYRQKVCLRYNPYLLTDFTHRYIITSRKENKFGLTKDEVMTAFSNLNRYKNLDISGLHIHIGSQITNPCPFIKAIKKTRIMIKYIESRFRKIEVLNIGGGLAAQYKEEERPQTAKEFSKNILPLLEGIKAKIILEPGRFVVANSGILLTRVLYTKEAGSRNFCIVDAGMNDLIRPALYNAYHRIGPLIKRRNYRCYDVVGPVCESADFLGKSVSLPKLKQGEYLCVFTCGAYGEVMSSNYNSRPRSAAVLVSGNKYLLIREREKYSDLISKERMQEA